MSRYFLLYSLSIFFLFSTQLVRATETISVQGATSMTILNLAPNSTLTTIMASIEERIYVENVENHNFLGVVLAPESALTTIMANIEERIYVENVENHNFLGVVLAPESALTTIMANIEERIYVENVENYGSIGTFVQPPSDLVDMLQLDEPLKSPEANSSQLSTYPTITPIQLTQININESPTPTITTVVTITSTTSPTDKSPLIVTLTP